MESEVAAFQTEKLRQLAEEPNTTVYEPTHDYRGDPWPAHRLREVTERIAAKVTAYGDDVTDFRVRKDCLKDPDILEFSHTHPKLFGKLTDRAILKDPRFRDSFSFMLHVRDKVDAGSVTEGRDADAMATNGVIKILQQSKRPTPEK